MEKQEKDSSFSLQRILKGGNSSVSDTSNEITVSTPSLLPDLTPSNEVTVSTSNLFPEAAPFPSFTTTFDNFFLLAEKVLQHNLEGELILGSSKSNGFSAGFNDYRTIYSQTRDSPKHIEKIKEVYSKCRLLFLKDAKMEEFMEWFRDKSSFVIAPREKSPRKLYLTVIFRKCCKIAEHIAEEADRHPDKADQLLADPAAIYPEHFMLCMLRLFYHCADEIDRGTMIMPRINEIEKMLGLKKDETPMVSDGLSDLFSSMTEVAREAGLELPKDTPQINGNQFREALSGMTKNPQAKQMIKDVFQGLDLKNVNDLPSAIGKLLGKMQETAAQVPEPVKRSMEATASQ